MCRPKLIKSNIKKARFQFWQWGQDQQSSTKRSEIGEPVNYVVYSMLPCFVLYNDKDTLLKI